MNGDDKPDLRSLVDADFIVSQLGNADQATKERLANEIAEALWSAQRSRVLTDVDQHKVVRILQSGSPVTADTAGVTRDLNNKSLFKTLDFRGQTVQIDASSHEIARISGGAGSDCLIDVLVSKCFASLSGFVEGQSFTTLSGCLLYGYSTYGAGVTKAATLFTATKSSVTIAVCAGDYSGEGSISWPTVLYTSVGGGNFRPAIKTIGQSAEMQYIGQNTPEALLPGITIIAPAANYVIPHIVTESVGFFAAVTCTHTSSYSIQASRTQFFGRIRGTLVNCSFSDCYLGVGTSNNSILFNGTTGSSEANALSITGCTIAGIIDLRAADESDPYGTSIVVTGNQFRGDNAALYLGSSDVVVVSGNTFTTTSAGRGADAILFDPADSYSTGHMVISGNSFEEGPTTTNALIRFNSSTTTQGSVNSLAITGNTFGGKYAGSVAATTAYIKLTGSTSRRFRSVAIVGNSFGEPGNDTDWLESRGGFSVIGDWVERSVFGPNSPAAKVSYNITNGANNEFYPATSAGGTSVGGDAPSDAQYLTLATNTTLTSERVWTPGNGLQGTDAGAGSTYTAALGLLIANWEQTALFNINHAGHLGLGNGPGTPTAATTAIIANITETVANKNAKGIVVDLKTSIAGTVATSVALSFAATLTATTGTEPVYGGMDGSGQHGGLGATITDLFGMRAALVSTAGTGAITRAMGIWVNAASWGAGVIPVTTHVLRADDQGNASVTTAYGLKIAAQTGTNPRSFIADPLVLGGSDRAKTALLDLAGDARFAPVSASSTPASGDLVQYNELGTQFLKVKDASGNVYNETHLHLLPAQVDVTVASTTVPYQVVGPMPQAGVITNVYAKLGENKTNGATSSIFDIHLITAANQDTDGQGTTVYTTQGNRPTIANTHMATTATAPDVTSFAAGDWFAVYTDQAGTNATVATVSIALRYT